MRSARITAAIALALFALCAAPAGASAAFGFEEVELGFSEGGLPATLAGSHPDMGVDIAFNTVPDPEKGSVLAAFAKDLVSELPPGLVVNPTAVPACERETFRQAGEDPDVQCPDETAVGVTEVLGPGELSGDRAAVYNLEPSLGSAAKLGFHLAGFTVTIAGGIRDSGEYNAFATVRNLSQVEEVAGARLTLWGNPSSSTHDGERGDCLGEGGSCPVPPEIGETAFVTLPRACTGPLGALFSADSWSEPGVFVQASPAEPFEATDCAALGFEPTIGALPTASSAESSTGLDFDLEVDDPGLLEPGERADSDIKKTEVTLPAGITVNPSSGEGLGACTAAQFAQESASMAPGEGCPDAAKIGSVEVTTPLLEEPLGGSLYLAQQDDPASAEPGAENPFDSMLAFYVIVESERYGVLVKQAGEVVPDPATGQLVSTVDGIPQLPFSDFHLHFREGPRAPLITPPACGPYTTEAKLTPWADPSQTVAATATFEVTSGIGGGPCPAGAKALHPRFVAGTLDNRAGTYSPLVMHLTREDPEQEFVSFSSSLPPGLVAKLAGVAKCPEAAIAAARAKSGREEIAAPSCPASSQIGRVLAGAGVGSALTYVPGKIYLAGPFAGDPLSVVVVTPGVAGPIDLGDVVLREALRLDPETAEVRIDGAVSDPIPRILKGIPLKLRDLRVYVDREGFALNPTNCDPLTATATLAGAEGGQATVPSPFQAASCAALPFKPTLKLRLSGGTNRSSHPALRAEVRARPGDANIGKAVVLFPHSMFLEQGHIRTICTRVQFAANACPPGSVYGHARAITPLLDEALEGPVYLRSNGGERELPDLVAALHGVVEIDVVGYIDSVHERLRSRFLTVPDAPVTSFVLNMQGHKKGLIAASEDLCARKQRATLAMGGQNGRVLNRKTKIAVAGCGGKKGKRGKGRG